FLREIGDFRQLFGIVDLATRPRHALAAVYGGNRSGKQTRDGQYLEDSSGCADLTALVDDGKWQLEPLGMSCRPSCRQVSRLRHETSPRRCSQRRSGDGEVHERSA